MSLWKYPLSHQRVVDAVGGLGWEAGPELSADWRPRAVAVVASWSDRSAMSKSLSTLTWELAAHEYDVLLVSAAETAGPLTWPYGRHPRVSVYRRPNIGYDFGSWSVALHHFPQIRTAHRSLLINDSLVGPFRALDFEIAGFESCTHPVWGLVDTTQKAPHLQSHFVGYRHGALCNPAVEAFWSGIRVISDKEKLIDRYEVGLGRVLQRQNLTVAAQYPWHWVAGPDQNPTVLGWRRLLDRGFPFVKREVVLRPPPGVTDADDVADEIQHRFGQDLAQWL